jgi:hypothetical protein
MDIMNVSRCECNPPVLKTKTKKMKNTFKIMWFFLFVFRPQKGIVEFIERENRSKKDIYKDIIAANSVLKKIVCPPQWNIYISHDYSFTQIMFIHHESDKEESPLKNYLQICSEVERFCKLNKSFSDSSGMNSLDADSDVVNYGGGKIKFRIVQLQIDKCDIEWKEVIVKKPILSGFCAEAIKQ